MAHRAVEMVVCLRSQLHRLSDIVTPRDDLAGLDRARLWLAMRWKGIFLAKSAINSKEHRDSVSSIRYATVTAVL